jgi:hypothetical protein
MEPKKILCAAMMVAMVTGISAPAFAQNRFMDEARDAANRRSENKAVREAEHPAEEAKPTATASTATPAPVETAPAAQSAPATPAAATPATPAPAQ